MADSNFKLKTSLPGSRTSHLDACTSMEQIWPSTICTHNTPNVTHTLGQVWAKILCPNSTPMHSLKIKGRLANKTKIVSIY
jgi:hypothetical protein